MLSKGFLEIVLLFRDVHIVELLSASFDIQKSYPLPVVELSIKSKIRKQLFVILKCRHPVKWKISTSRVKGSVNFIVSLNLIIVVEVKVYVSVSLV